MEKQDKKKPVAGQRAAARARIKASPVESVEAQYKAWLTGDTEIIVADDVELENLQELRAKIGFRRPVVRLALGVHRVDAWILEGKLTAIVRATPTKVRVPSFVNHLVIPLSEYRNTVKLRTMGGLPFSTGLTAIVAPGGSGKTPLLWSLADAFEKDGRAVRRIKFGEPRGDYLSDYAELMAGMLNAILFGEDLFIDSFKNPVYDLPGAATTGGMSSWLWPTLSDISSLMDRFGRCMITLVNPTSSEQRVVANAVEALKTSTNGIITTAAGGQWAGYYRDIETGDRAEVAFVSNKERFEYAGSVVDRSAGQARSSVSVSTSGSARLSVDAVLASALTKLVSQEEGENNSDITL